MRLKQWWLAHQQDERERFYYARAGAAAYIAMALACLVQALIFMVQGHQEEARSLMGIVGIGTAVWGGLILHWNVTR